MKVPYGIHWEGAVAWLVQGRRANNFVGLRATSPFIPPKGMCNHSIAAAAPVPDRIHWEIWATLAQDPLVRAMLPLPRENAVYVEDPNDELALYLTTLSRLSSPITSIIKPTWMMKVKDLEKELVASNIQPLVLVQADPKGQEIVDAIGKLSPYTPRPVVIVGTPDVVVSPPLETIQTRITEFELADLISLPLENIGAAMLRRYARNEELWNFETTR